MAETTQPQTAQPPAQPASTAAPAATPSTVTINTAIPAATFPVNTFATVQPMVEGHVVTSLTSAAVVAAERARISAILTAPEAQGREALARTLALETTQDAETARRILAAAPAAQAAAPPVSPLAAEMARIKNPAVGVAPGDGDTAASEAQRVLAFVPKSNRYPQAS